METAEPAGREGTERQAAPTMRREGGEGFRSAEELAPELRRDLGELLLVLADNKRLLGIRYSDWILGAPALEAGISCSAMAQDEWGHARIVYAMLREFGMDPERLEHGREASEYRNVELLDGPARSWPELLALNLLLDTALSVQFESMAESRYEPLHYKVGKLLDEERFHFDHARGWTARLATTERGRGALRRAFGPPWSVCVRWFGPPDDAAAARLAAAGITAGGPEALRQRWLARVGPAVEAAGLELAERTGHGWRSRVEPAWDAWDPARRRGRGAAGPEPDTLARVRGDRNRALLLE